MKERQKKLQAVKRTDRREDKHKEGQTQRRTDRRKERQNIKLK